ncbi:hypothetical protein [Ekhidna sp.]
MKSTLFLLLFSLISSFNNTVSINDINTEFQKRKLSIDWLSGNQPKLLSSMASTKGWILELDGESRDLKAIAGGWHAQAVGQYKNFVYVAFSDGSLGKGKAKVGSSDKAGKLWIYNVKTKENKLIDLEKGYAHPCGIQVTGKFLTIVVEAEYGLSQAALGDERDEKSLVLIYDLEKDPYCSVEAGRIAQNTVNSGGAGLAYSPTNKCWYMLVDQDAQNGKVVIYKTKNEKINTWEKQPIAAYKRFGSGAGLNLITASDNSIWGLFYDNSALKKEPFPKYDLSSDKVRLFKLVNSNGKLVSKRTVYTQTVNITKPRIKGVGELLANTPSMRFGASLRFENGKLELLTCQRNMDKSFKIHKKILKDSDKTHAVFMNLAKARGEIKCSSQRTSSQKFKEQNLQTESWSAVLDSPITVDLNYMTEKSAISNFGRWSDAIEKNTKAPLALIYLEGSSSVSGKMIEYFSKQSVDEKMNP